MQNREVKKAPPKSVRSKATEQRLLPNVNRVTTAFQATAMLRHTERHRRSGAVYKIQLADSAVSRKREPSAEQRRQAASRERGVSSDRSAQLKSPAWCKSTTQGFGGEIVT